MGAGSRLAALGQQRRALAAGRKIINPDAARGAPQAPSRAVPNPPPLVEPAAPPPSEEAPPVDPKAARLQQVQGFLDTVGRGGAAPTPPREPVQGAPPTAAPEMIADRTRRLGSPNVSPTAEFYRMSGRLPSPRELSIFRARKLLEGQLQRPPTSRELKAFIARPMSLSTAAPTALEV